jgi:hypothetical protein
LSYHHYVIPQSHLVQLLKILNKRTAPCFLKRKNSKNLIIIIKKSDHPIIQVDNFIQLSSINQHIYHFTQAYLITPFDSPPPYLSFIVIIIIITMIN